MSTTYIPFPNNSLVEPPIGNNEETLVASRIAPRILNLVLNRPSTRTKVNGSDNHHACHRTLPSLESLRFGRSKFYP